VTAFRGVSSGSGERAKDDLYDIEIYKEIPISQVPIAVAPRGLIGYKKRSRFVVKKAQDL
jgi:hypothetical protein